MAKPARELPQFHRLSPVKPGVRKQLPQPAAVVVVGAKALARHLDLTHPRINQLTHEEHVLEQLPDGKYNLDESRVRYIRWLRDPERRTAKSKADQEFTQAKADLIRIRIAEKQRDLIPYVEAEETGDKMIGIVITKLSGQAARIGGTMEDRRRVDRVVFEIRTEMADAFNEMANKVEAEEQLKQASTTDGTDDR